MSETETMDAAPEASQTAGDRRDPAAQADATPPPAGLFDAAEAERPTATPKRPDFLDEAFWDSTKGVVRVEALAKSQRDLRSRLARGEGRVPDTAEGYSIPKIEGVAPDQVRADDPLWGEIRKAAHAAQVTQSQMDALLRPFFAAVAAQQPNDEADAAPDYTAELAKLGPNGRQVVQDVGGWLAGLHARGILSPAELADLRGIGTANGVRALAKLREMLGERAIPTEAMQPDAATQADLQRMLRDGYAKNDPDKRAQAIRGLEGLARGGQLRGL
jgi:hypothetical protein